MTVQNALIYPSANISQLHTAVVRLIDVVRTLAPGADVTEDLDDIRGDLTTVTGTLSTVQSQINQMETDIENILLDAYSAQDLLEIHIDHAQEATQGSRAEFQRFIQAEMDRMLDAVLRIRQLVHNNTAQIVNEQVARVTENEAFAQTVTGVVADLADTTALVLDEQTARATADAALASDITAVEATVGSNTSSINTLNSTVSTLTSSTAASITALQAEVDAAEASVTAEALARANADTALSGTLTTVQASVASNTAAITSEATARAAADSALSTRLDTVEAETDANAASVTAEATARTTADTALAAQITTVQSNVDTVAASVTTEAATRATADTAISSTVTALTATVAGNTASITSLTTAVAAADESLAADISALEVSTADNAAAITAEAVARTTTDDALSALITTVQASANSNTSAISAESATRASADSALAADITTVSTTVDGHTTSINTLAASVDGVAARWGVSINVDGDVVGLVRLDGGASGSVFSVLANKFEVVNPANAADSAPMFSVGQVNGVTTVGISGNAVIDDTITARHISVTSLDAISANLGTVTAGVIQSPGGETYWNLATGETRFAYYTDWIETLESATSAADDALNASVSSILVSVGQIESDVAALEVESLDAQDRFEIALDHSIDTVSGSRAEFERYIQDELVRVAELALNAQRLTSNNAGQIIVEQTVRTNATESLASQLTAITADLGATNAAIVTEELARVDGDNALATSVSTVAAGVASNSASITTLSTVQSGIQSDVTTLQSDVTGIETDLGQVQAQWGVAINVNGQVVGLVRMDGAANGSTFTVLADKFVVAHPTTGGSLTTPFIVGQVNGVSTVGINGTLVVDGTILTRHLAANSVTASNIAAGSVAAIHMNVGSLSSITANIGTVTAGVLRSADGNMIIDLNNKIIQMTA